MNTRCKFRCREVIKRSDVGSVVYDVKMYPVTDGSKENEEFFKYTPAGEFVLLGLKSDHGFVPGDEYYLDVVSANPK